MTPIESLHACYVQITGMEPKLAIHERAYFDFLSHGFTEDDWRCVLLHLRLQNRKMNGAAYSLRLSSLLDFEYHKFDSFLSEARALQRNRMVKTPKQQVVAEWRGVAETQTGSEAVMAHDAVKAALAKLARDL